MNQDKFDMSSIIKKFSELNFTTPAVILQGKPDASIDASHAFAYNDLIRQTQDLELRIPERMHDIPYEWEAMKSETIVPATKKFAEEHDVDLHKR